MTSVAEAASAASPHNPRPRARRARAIAFAALAITALIILVAVGVRADTDAAQAEYLLARADAEHAETRLFQLTTALDAAIRDGSEVELVLDAVLAVEGEGLDLEARDQLALAASSVALPDGFSGTLPPPLHTSDAGSAAQWRERASTQREWLATLEDHHRAVSADVDATRSTIAELTAALRSYTDATGAAGATLLADRADASPDSRTALQSAIEALAHATPDDATSRLEAYVTATAAVLVSSEDARRPRSAASGDGGSGLRIPDPGSLTAVVNKARSLSASYAPNDLRRPSGVGNALPLRDAAASAAERMAADMAAAGITLRMSSGYRSYGRQATLYSGFAAREGETGADAHSARPGHSEHQTGLAADFDDGSGCNLKVCFRDRPGGIWLAENAWKHGWILRYGDGWQPTVGYRFEPWHYRFVGVDVAAAMRASGTTTLEDFFGTGPAPDYLG